jgi:hypothetical protein
MCAANISMHSNKQAVRYAAIPNDSVWSAAKAQNAQTDTVTHVTAETARLSNAPSRRNNRGTAEALTRRLSPSQ